jgi:uncharacterized membrane protein
LVLGKVVTAIQEVETHSPGEIRVHVSKRIWEKDPLQYARFLFRHFNIQRTQYRNGVLIYLNLQTRKYALVADDGFNKKVDARYWDDLGKFFERDLQSTHYENALVMLIRTIGETLRQSFPA